jgi:serine/threonine-protein kinase
MSNPEPGTTIGSYQIEGTIGAGSMGDVFKGVDVHLHRKVAVKILSEKHRDSPELRARFVREGRAVAAIQHPNVVQVFTTGVFDERPFIAMEFLDGTDLGTILEEQGPLSSAVAAKMVLDAARGLEAAAKAGLIHRDVKPSNLVRLTDGRVKVTDFGLAKPVDPGSEPALTALGVVVGTPDYIAPEQARGDAIDERVDIYALGGTLYYLLIGLPPFRTGKPAEDKYLKVVARHLRQPPPDARLVRPEIDDELAELVRAMMAKKPADRPDYGALIEQLGGIVARLGGNDSSGRVRSPSRSAISGLSRLPHANQAPGQRTPFVGGETPHGFREEASEDAPAMSDSSLVPKKGLPGWLLAVTVISALVLIVGIGAYLMKGSGATPAAKTPAAAVDAGAKPAAPPDAAVPARPALPVPPAGMVLVVHPDGTPWFFVDKQPVAHGQYAKVFPKQKKSSPTLDPQPVTGIAYNFARAYAQSTDRRLLTGPEYDAAMATAGVTPTPTGLSEWIDAPAPDDKKEIRSAAGKKALRAQTGQKDVTFRLAKDAR